MSCHIVHIHQSYLYKVNHRSIFYIEVSDLASFVSFTFTTILNVLTFVGIVTLLIVFILLLFYTKLLQSVVFTFSNNARILFKIKEFNRKCDCSFVTKFLNRVRHSCNGLCCTNIIMTISFYQSHYYIKVQCSCI